MSSLLSPCRFAASFSSFTPSRHCIISNRTDQRISLSLPVLSRLRSNSMTSHAIFAPDSGPALTESSPVASPNDSAKADNNSNNDDVLVQYVVLRRDLIDAWPLGSVVTQGCHASVSAIWSHKDDSHTLHYCSPQNIDSMHKVTVEVKGETQILNMSEKLKAGGIAYKLWIEQPENFPTCLATKPYPKSMVSLFFKQLKLSK